MKIGLMWPGFENTEGFYDTNAPLARVFRIPRLNLPLIAACTPEEHEIFLYDEEVEPIDMDRDCDVVGLSVQTHLAKRAYELAREHQERGRYVVMGGIHVAACPEEAAQHADTIFVGEAEHTWPAFIRDFERGEPKKIYKEERNPPLINMPIARRDLLKRDLYMNVDTLAVWRGCPYRCNFCSIYIYYGNMWRFRPLSEIVAEVDSLKSRYLYFMDDIINAHPKHSKDLFRALRPLRKKWYAQATMNVAKDLEMLDLMSKSGCVALYLGIETASTPSLREMHKMHNNIRQIREITGRLHDYGISVIGGFVFGFDHDGPDIFEATLEFIDKSNIDVAYFHVLTPYPRTDLYTKLQKEGRLLYDSWWVDAQVSANGVYYKPIGMTEDQLQEGFSWLNREYFRSFNPMHTLRQRGRQGVSQVVGSLILRKAWQAQFESSYGIEPSNSPSNHRGLVPA